MKTIRIGCGAGYAADRWEPALELIESCRLDYLAFECLAERTIALGQLERLRDPDKGYNPYLEDRWRLVLGPAKARGVKIVTNMGAANPIAAARRTVALARELGIPDLKVAVVTGDDVLGLVQANPDLTMLESGAPVGSLGNGIVAANAYLGAEPIRDALAMGADVVITGRVADPSLFLGPMMHAFGWAPDDWPRIAAGATLGHLLECAGQVTGGYFADPGIKDVPDLDRLGFPFAEVGEDGSAMLSKPEGSGGLVSPATLTEQILYECGDPAAYITPDCVADFTGLAFDAVGPNRVRVAGARCRPRTDSLKVSVCHRAGHIGEAHVGYAGANALARAELAAAIVRERLAQRGLDLEDLRVDLVGVNSLHGAGTTGNEQALNIPHAEETPAPRAPQHEDRGGLQPHSRQAEPYEIRLRVAARSRNRRHAEYVAQETQSLLTNGPYGGGGDFMAVRDLVGVKSVLMPRDWVTPRVELLS